MIYVARRKGAPNARRKLLPAKGLPVIMSSDEHPWSRIFPELRRFRSRGEAQEVLGKFEEAFGRFETQLLKRPKYWITLVASCVPGAIVMLWSVQSASYLSSILGPMAIFAGPILGTIWLSRQQWRRFLRQELNARGIPICMKCAYDLTGNESGVCPECGTRVES